MNNEAEDVFKNKIDAVIAELREIAEATRIDYLQTITRLLSKMKETPHASKEERDQMMSALFRAISDDDYDFLDSEIYRTQMRPLMDAFHDGIG